MRLLSVSALGLLVVLSSTSAVLAASSSNPTNLSFASMTCPTRLTCPDSSPAPTTEELVANANSCFTKFTGASNPTGFFTDANLNSSNCLTAKPDAMPKGIGPQLTPKCCVIKLEDSTCTFRCEVVPK